MQTHPCRRRIFETSLGARQGVEPVKHPIIFTAAVLVTSSADAQHGYCSLDSSCSYELVEPLPDITGWTAADLVYTLVKESASCGLGCGAFATSPKVWPYVKHTLTTPRVRVTRPARRYAILEPAHHAAAPAPAGISLSRAAAERLSLKIDLEGVFLGDGRIVLAGRPNRGESIDAALFLTALRLACAPGDPYFSLDPDDGKAWSREGERASKELWRRIKSEFSAKPELDQCVRRRGRAAKSLRVRSISARRDYRRLWQRLESAYPNLRTRLVFRPGWLRTTRFGEILYKADLLLKELSTGVPALSPSTARRVRAEKVPGYVSSQARDAAKTLISAPDKRRRSRKWRGHRLWFDLVPQTETVGSTPSDAPIRRTGASSRLIALLKARGYLGAPSPARPQPISLATDGEAIDLSQIFPKMFVRRHDSATGRDLPGNDPSLDALVADVNKRTVSYAAVYRELRDLTEIFRAYVAAVGLKNQKGSFCRALPRGLLDAERARSPLPDHHPSELFMTVATYVDFSGKRCWASSGRVSSINGGVALRGKSLYDRAVKTAEETAVTRDLRRELADDIRKAEWTGKSGRRFIVLTLDGSAARAHPASPGTRIERETAEMVLPYALMSRNAYREYGKSHRTDATRRIAKWEAVFEKAGYSAQKIRLIKKSGFYAAIYKNRRTNEITIAYRGLTKPPAAADVGPPRQAELHILFRSAVELARIVRRKLDGANISLTGHGLGGGLAAYAGERTKTKKVIVFNATSMPTYAKVTNPDLINIIVPGA